MGPLKAHVEKGRLILNEPTSLPEGTVLELAPIDGGDDLDETERAALHSSIRESLAEYGRGETHPLADALRDIRAKK